MCSMCVIGGKTPSNLQQQGQTRDRERGATAARHFCFDFLVSGDGLAGFASTEAMFRKLGFSKQPAEHEVPHCLHQRLGSSL